MQPMPKVLRIVLGLIAAASAIPLGCLFHTAEECELIGLCAPGGSSTGAGGTPPSCVPSENPGVVSDACGVFASDSLGDDAAGDGTKDKPFKTLATALMRAGSKPVYACNEIFAEAVVISGGNELYGGIECSQGWIYGGDTARTTIAPAADQIPLTLSSGSATSRIENILAQAADAMMPGGSSVAVKAEEGSTAELTRCDLMAGNGAVGEPGMPGDPNGMPATGGQMGNSGGMACSADSVPGGAQVETICGTELSAGGNGGVGNQSTGGDGAKGLPDLALGQGGIGEPFTGNWSCGVGEGGGNTGANGTSGMPGTGATGMGMLTASGYIGVPGGTGMPGTPGQGGGGGGGAKGGAACSASTKGGASGGSGGSGGCGGLPGGGGGPGGASIGLLSFDANVTLTDCTITAGNGGTGGKGGDAQAGGTGGPGGMGGSNNGIAGLSNGCPGGYGGNGGSGGPGGGGLGGPSFAIAHVGAAPGQRGMVSLTKGGGGPGGPGGNNDVAANAGAPGTSADVQAF